MAPNLHDLARHIIKHNQYLTLATVDNEKGMWVCILCYAYDSDFNFYFASLDTSRHSRNITQNNAVTFAIYDSRQDWGIGVGLQIEGLIDKVSGAELPKVTAMYFSRKFPFGSATGDFAMEFRKQLDNKTYNFYKIIPTKIWINNPDANVDERVEVNLSGK